MWCCPRNSLKGSEPESTMFIPVTALRWLTEILIEAIELKSISKPSWSMGDAITKMEARFPPTIVAVTSRLQEFLQNIEALQYVFQRDSEK